MANRHWVGGSANWDSTAGTKWATTSGGAGGAAVPTELDDVFFDANSGAATVNMVTGLCKDLNFTGFTGTFNLSLANVTVHGSLVLGASGTYVGNKIVYFRGSTDTTITSNSVSCSFSYYVIKDDATKKVSLADALSNSGSSGIYLYKGGFDTGGFNITTHSLTISTAGLATFLTLGASTVTIDGDDGYGGGTTIFSTSATSAISAGTSTIKFTGTPTKKLYLSLASGANTFNNIWFDTGDSIYPIQVNSSCTFNEFKVSPGSYVGFAGGETVTATTFNLVGTSGDLVKIAGLGATNVTLSQANGIVDTNYVDATEITVAGGAIWYWGTNNTDSGSNSGWHYRWTNTTNMYSSNNSYATCPATSGVLDVYLSKDAGLNWQLVRSKTFNGSEASLTYGDGDTETWGASWIGDDVDDTSFMVRIQHGQYVALLTDFGSGVPSASFLNGIKVIIEAKYESSTFSVDHVNVTLNYSDVSSPVVEGSTAYATNGRKNGEGAGSGTGVLVFYDGSNWIAVDSGQTVAA